MKWNLVLLLIGFTLVCCSDALTNYHEVSLDEEFSLRIGESVILSNYNVVLKFDSVTEDSRCPMDAICIWAGNAVVVLELKFSGRQVQTVKLNTNLDPKNIEFSNFIIILKNLTPYPRSDEIINSDDYMAKLIVKKKEN